MMSNRRTTGWKRRRVASKSGLVPVSARQAESNLASRVVAISKLVKGLKPELKYIDVSLTSTNVPVATGVTIHMTPIAQGVTQANRVGDAVRLLSWELNFIATHDVAATTVTVNPSFRFYIVQDMQQVADTAPTLGDLVDQPGLPNIQLMNVNIQKRFRVLWDSKPQVYRWGTFTASDTSSTVFPFKIQFNLKRKMNVLTRFNGVNNTDIQKNGIYLMVSSNATTSAPAATFDFSATSRIGFTDV